MWCSSLGTHSCICNDPILATNSTCTSSDMAWCSQESVYLGSFLGRQEVQTPVDNRVSGMSLC